MLLHFYYQELFTRLTSPIHSANMASSTTERIPTRQRRPSTGAPIVDIQGSVSPAGISRPKHKRTFTGFGATEIKSVEGSSQPPVHSTQLLLSGHYSYCCSFAGHPAWREPQAGSISHASYCHDDHLVSPQLKQQLIMCPSQLRSPNPSEWHGLSTK